MAAKATPKTKPKVDAKALFSIHKNTGVSQNKVLVSGSDSEDEKLDPKILSLNETFDQEEPRKVLVSSESEDEGFDPRKFEKLDPKKLSFVSSENTSKNESRSSFTQEEFERHQESLVLKSCSEDEAEGFHPQKLSFVSSENTSKDASRDLDELTRGLETCLLDEYENETEGSSQSTPEKKGTDVKKPRKIQRKRIVALASSSSDDEPSDASDKENDASFDIGSIKKRFATPKPKHIVEEESDENEYDLEDSFINDEEEDDNGSSSGDSESSEEEIQVKPKKKPQKTTVTSDTLLASLSHTEINIKTHALARKYVENFSKHKVELADFLFKLFNTEIFDGCMPYDMKLTWSKRLNKTAGRCICKRQGKERWCEIELATKVLTSADRLRDTLIHEMCHAAAWIIAEYSDGHGPIFKSWGNRAVKIFPELPLITRCHNYDIESKFSYICQDCGKNYKRHSKSIDTLAKLCGSCGKLGKGKLILHVLDKKAGKYIPENDGKPNPFAAFVKENYKHHRTPGKSHAEAMKELSKKFSDNKL